MDDLGSLQLGSSQRVLPSLWYPTYTCVLNDFAFATTAQDIVNISNPSAATTAFILTRLYVAMDATAASTYDIYLSRRTAADTGGTAVLLTQANFAATQAVGSGAGVTSGRDSTDPSCVAVINAYTVNPTVYGAGYLVDAGHLTIPAAATPAVPNAPWDMYFGNRGCKPPVLRPGQYWGVNINGQAAPAGISAYIAIEWVEIPLRLL